MPRRPVGWSPQQRPDFRQQRRSFPCRLDTPALELVTDTQIGMQTRGILVKVQERSGAAIEHSSFLLDETADRAKVFQQWFDTFEGFFTCVLHHESI